MREWQDLFSQLRQVAGDLGIRAGTEAGHPDHVHQAVLAGLLSHVGMRDRDGREYRGARGATFAIARGSVLAKRPPRWVMAAELVETNRLWARRVAAIQPEWAERVGAHLVKRSYGEPRWDAAARRGGDHRDGDAVRPADRRAAARSATTASTAPAARELFIRHALVEGDWTTHHAFVERNRAFVERVAGAGGAGASRRPARRRGACSSSTTSASAPTSMSARHFDRWWKRRRPTTRTCSTSPTTCSTAAAAFRPADYPDTWRDGDLVLPLTYRFDPGGPLDGVTVHVPLTALNQVTGDGLDWQIPGHRAELVGGARAHAAQGRPPRADPGGRDDRRRARAARAAARPARRRARRGAAPTVSGVDGRAPATSTRARVPAHLRMNFVVADADGTVHDADDDLDAIRARLAADGPGGDRRGRRRSTSGAASSTWDVGTLPQVVETSQRRPRRARLPGAARRRRQRVAARADQPRPAAAGDARRRAPAAAADGGAVGARRPARPRPGRPAGARRQRRRRSTSWSPTAAVAAVDRVMADHGELPWDADAFAALQRAVRARRAGRSPPTRWRRSADILAAAARVRPRLDRLVAPARRSASVADAAAHLDRLVRPGFVVDGRHAGGCPTSHRYVRGDRVPARPARRRRRPRPAADGRGRAARAALPGAVAAAGRRPVGAEVVELGWQLEELRVSVFAQPVGVHGAVSPTRVRRRLDALG